MPLALGTDTAGSGRVPAMLNNIVGLKPSLGLISNAGLVPACRTLDCISVFSLTVDDAMTALAAMAGPDGADPFSRDRPLGALSAFPEKLRLGVPRNGQLIFFGDRAAEKAYGEALERWTSLGATLVEFDLEPFYETARLLYEGPWVAERYLVIRDLLASSPDSIHPVTREITARRRAADGGRYVRLALSLAGAAAHGRAHLCRSRRDGAADGADRLFDRAGAGQSDRTQLARLGTYTNFVNLLDLCGLALPAAMRADGIPFGITLLAPAGRDAALASIGRVFHADTKLKMGAKGLTQPALAALPAATSGDEITIAVVGAHLSGMALNGELQALGGRLLEATTTAPDYKLYALDTMPPKPGMLRVDAGAGQFDQAGAMGVVGGSVRQIRRCDPAAARDRHGTAGRWKGREGFCGGAGGDRRRARYFVVRRLARVHGGEGVESSFSGRAKREPGIHASVKLVLIIRSRTVRAAKSIPGSPRCGASGMTRPFYTDTA